MKTKSLKTFVFALLGVFLSLQVFPQDTTSGDDWKNNEDCLRNLSLYYEFYKHKNYEDAITPWREVYRICPESKESLYAYGVNIYRYFLDKTSDPEKKAAYADTIMMIYDKRIQYFPENKGDVLGRKGVDLLRYRRNDGIEFIKQGYDILEQSIEIEGEKSSPVVLTTFVTAGVTLYLQDQLDNEKVIKDYVQASNILEKQRPTSTVKRAQKAIEDIVKEGRIMTCESIQSIFGPKFEENSQDQDWLKLVIGFMDDANCTGEDLYAKASEKLYELNPDAEAAYNLGRMFLKKEQYDKAKDYYLQAIELAKDDENKATYLYELGVIEQNYLKNPQLAVKYASQAAELKPDWGDPYILMGSAYAAGTDSFSDDFEKRTVYWVAVDMFYKAKSVDPSVADRANSLISEFSNYFPSKEDLFFRSIEEGSRYTVGGWIGRSTTARAKN